MNLAAVILAAGKGVRMCSSLPKVVHSVAGKPIIVHVAESIKKAGIDDIILVVGHGREKVQQVMADNKITVKYALQEQQLGTGHALMQARELINPESTLLVLAGDIPLLQPETIRDLITSHQQSKSTATILSAKLDNPYGYGRIIRNLDLSFARIVEEKDADSQEKLVTEVNSGIYCFQAGAAFDALSRIKAGNAQGEYYLTDILEILKNAHYKVDILVTDNSEEINGINDRIQLAQAARIMQKRKNLELMQKGVTIVDPESTFVDNNVEIGCDTIIFPFTILEGHTTIGQSCQIGPSTRISSSIIGDNVIIESSRIKEAVIGNGCNIGPFAYLRPETVLENEVKIGDFVEVKKSVVGEKSKIPHLSYVGDALIGCGVNVGAGTITCNYDGQNKYQTIIEDQAFIGSNTNLVAPVKVGKQAVTGAGSTITRDVPLAALAVERAEQRIIKDWALRKKKD